MEAHEALIEASGIRFIGNLEGRDLAQRGGGRGRHHGFTGNVALKTLEGTASAVAEEVRGAARSGPLAAAGGLLLKPALGGLRRSMDPNWSAARSCSASVVSPWSPTAVRAL